MWTALGSAGIGLVWGWLIGRPRTPLAHPVRAWLTLTAATAAVAVLIFRLAGLVSMLVFFAALPIAALSHYAWIRRLSDRVGEPRH